MVLFAPIRGSTPYALDGAATMTRIGHSNADPKERSKDTAANDSCKQNSVASVLSPMGLCILRGALLPSYKATPRIIHFFPFMEYLQPNESRGLSFNNKAHQF